MILIQSIPLPLDFDFSRLKNLAANQLKVDEKTIVSAELHKRSVDARNKKNVHFLASVKVLINADEPTVLAKSGNKNATVFNDTPYIFKNSESNNKSVRAAVIGTGPAGLFAAYTLCLSGIKPVIFERGDTVEHRVNSVDKFKADGILDTQSNIQFGEGGAGTFSDGKLNTGIKDVRIRAVLETFVKFGAPDEILWQAKPHIGTDILRKVIVNMRHEIERLGGEYHFCSTLDSINITNGKLKSIVIKNDGKISEYPIDFCVLAIGHSSRDTFYSLYNSGVEIEQKRFAVGVRIEHLQSMINHEQYGKFENNIHLSPADYKLAVKSDDSTGVYTFCMCPGGYVVPAASELETVVTNGMSNFLREGKNANSAVLVGIGQEDYSSTHPLAGIEFQRKIERTAFTLGGRDYSAPVQTVGSFLHGGKNEPTLVIPSYSPNVKFCDISEIFPDRIILALKKGIRLMDNKIHGFASDSAIITAPESRSSSPVRIIRNDKLNSVNVVGLLPCGEGAGYAGGITSAAVDGIKCAESVIENS